MKVELHIKYIDKQGLTQDAVKQIHATQDTRLSEEVFKFQDELTYESIKSEGYTILED